MLCCVPPVNVDVTRITFRKESYPLLNVGDGVKAILMTNLTIPNMHIKRLFFSCTDSTGKRSTVQNAVGCKFITWIRLFIVNIHLVLGGTNGAAGLLVKVTNQHRIDVIYSFLNGFKHKNFLLLGNIGNHAPTMQRIIKIDWYLGKKVDKF